MTLRQITLLLYRRNSQRKRETAQLQNYLPKEIDGKTMWKVRAAPDAPSMKSSAETSETFGAQPPHGKALYQIG